MFNRLAAAVERLGRPRLLVVGDLILDRYVWGTVQRVSPEAPVQVLDAGREEFRPGGAANVAYGLAVMGARVQCAGAIGADSEGRTLLRLLRECSVSPTGVIADRSRPTSMKTRLIAHSQQMLRIDRERREPLAADAVRRLRMAIDRAASSSDAAILSDYNKGTLTSEVCAAVLQAFARRKKPVIVGLKSRDFRKYRGATAASLNRAELTLISGRDDVERAARWVIQELGLQLLIVTLGERGLMVMPRMGASLKLPAVARQVYDVTGAGDSVLAMFTMGYASGLSVDESAELANLAAGVVVGKVGTATVTREELVRAATGSDGAAHRKILKRSALLAALAKEHERGRRIVFTNGCFDLLHVGHVRTLEFARSKGDVLVVGLNTDRSVRRLKGTSRPILREQDRAALLAALECVDYVTFFSENTPERLIRKIRPDILVKGMDYTERSVKGRDRVQAYGGRIELAPLVDGISTSELVRRIRENGQ